MSLNRRSLLAAGLTGALGGAGLTGCRFGNYQEQQTSPDQWTGYYNTTPSSVRLCANTTEASNCADRPTNLVPDEVGVVMTDPVIFYVKNLELGQAYLIPKTKEDYALPIYLGEDHKSLSYIGSSAAAQVWPTETGCTTKFYLEESGKLASPRLSLKAQIIRTYDGDCTAALLAMQKCYLNAADCGEASASANREVQLGIAGLFDQYIDAGLMTAQDISKLVSVGYEVSYE